MLCVRLHDCDWLRVALSLGVPVADIDALGVWLCDADCELEGVEL